MAMGRGSSLPPGGSNPFWSSRAQGEWRLRAERPIDLPVPGDDEETRQELEEEDHQPLQGGTGPGGERGRRQRRSRSREDRELETSGVFVTPPSGAMMGKGRGGHQGEGLRSSGQMPPEMEEKKASQSEGPEPTGSRDAQDSLRRALERGVVEQLHEENIRLKEKLRNLTAGTTSSGWSEVTAKEEGKRAKEDQSPVRVIPSPEPPRYTPNGTRVPSGPPPADGDGNGGLPELPVWPFSLEKTYEQMKQPTAGRFMQLGSERVKLRGELDGGGMESRHGQDEDACLPGHGARPRQGEVEHYSGAGRGTSSRHEEVRGVHQELMSTAEARATWLERELIALKKVIEKETKGNAFATSTYWSSPTMVGGADQGNDRAQHHHQADFPGDRVLQPHQTDLRGDRAEQLNQADLRGDRVLQPPQTIHRGDRAWQLHHSGDGRHGEVGADLGRTPESSTTATGVGGNQDQGGNHRTVELPELSGGDLTPLILGDWLEVVKPLMMDLSPQASRWWVLVVEESYKYYHEWRKATPMERLKIVPESAVVRTDLTLHRTEQRGISLLLKAIPTAVKETVIAERLMTTTGILFTLLKNFQPGGSSERTMLLKELSEIKVGKSPSEACAGVRSWRRFYMRTKEIDATVPDPIILLKALEPAVQLISQLDAQATFRLAQSRAQLQVDARPEESSVWSYSECLLAELESLRLVHGATGVSNNAISTTTPALKMLGTRSSTTTACKFWGSDTGCRQGKRCSYLHDWASLEDRASRCFVCSSLHHKKMDCPVRPSAESFQTEGGSGQGQGRGGGPPKKGDGKTKHHYNKGGGKEKGKGKAKNEQEGPATKSLSTPTPEEKSGESGKGQGEGSIDETKETNKSDGGTGSMEAATLMSEVTSLLKSMRAGGNPQLNAVRLQRLDVTGQKTMLLDGGATHCLRPVKNEEEWRRSIEIPVFLASGTVTLRQVPGSETLVTQDKNTQPIVPLAALTQMGIQITWDEKGCEMKRGDGSKLPVFLDSGCPVMERIQGMELMAEVEHFNRQKTGIRQVIAARRMEASNGLCSDSQAKKALEIATLFPQVPAHLAAEIPGDETIDMSKVPLNRRQRKRIAESKSLTIHLFSGPQTSLWTCCESEGHVVLCVEIQKGLDLHNRALVAYLESLFRGGKVDLLLAGPPCRTVSLQRFRDDDGPPPVRGRDGLMRFGLPFNTFPNKQLCDQDSLLWLRLLWFSHVGVQANVEMEVGIEQPADPEGYLPPTRQRPRYGFPSFLDWPETSVIGETCSLRRIGFDQGRFGHPHKKPTEMLTNIPELYVLQDLRMEMGQGQAWSEELEKRLKQSKAAAAWAPGLVRLLQQVIKRKQDAVEQHGRRVSGQVEAEVRPPWRDREVIHQPDRDSSMESRDPPGMRALTAAELHDWRQHVANEHQPSRTDCAICLQNLGRDRPHRRIAHPSSYTLNVDIAGPFAGGKDQLETLPRYMIVGVFTVPLQDGTPLAEKLRAYGAKVESNIKDQEKEDPDFLWGEQEEKDVVDPFSHSRQDPEHPLTEAEIKLCDARDQEWKEMIQDLQDVQVCNLTLAAPLRSRHASEVQKALTYFYCKLRALGLPVLRLHSDRAKEFVSKNLAQWMRDHNVLHTTSSGDESQGSARAEREIGFLKGRVRLLLNASKSPSHYWPLALRHAAEARYRSQMSQLGVPLPRLIPFGTQAMAKFKRWHHVKDKDTWEHPMQRVTVYGPAMDMSSSSRGYYIESNGRWMRSTVVLETKNPERVEQGQSDHQEAQLEDRCDAALDGGIEDYESYIAPMNEFEDLQEGPEGRVLPEVLQVDDEPVEALTKRRLIGKQPPPVAYGDQQQSPIENPRMASQHEEPLFRVLRSGGECTLQDLVNETGLDSGEEEDVNWGEHMGTMEEWYDKEGCRWKDLQPQQDGVEEISTLHRQVQAVELLQQSEMRKLCREEVGRMDSVTQGKIVLKLEEECEELEARLKMMQLEEKEVFTSRTVALEEVRSNLDEWIPSLQAEYQSLLSYEAIQPISVMEYQKLHQSVEVTTIPGMVVSVIKPPYKLKSRFVACGNHVEVDPQDIPEIAAGGLDAIVARVMVAIAARHQWCINTADVRTAFLQAERRPTPGKVTVVTPPGLLRDTQILQEGPQERWLIKKAIYGLIESPKDWADHRDSVLQKVRWVDQETKQERWIEKTAENHLWQVRTRGQQDPEGFLGVYVDDLIVIGKDELVDQVMENLMKVFKMAEPTKVKPNKGVSFCGYEIGMDEDFNYTISQEKYVQELINKYRLEGTELQPVPKVTEAEDEVPISKKALKAAQTITGELLWVMTRSRPDICYATSLMTRMLHKRPSYVVEMGKHVIRYLASSRKMGLMFESGKDNEDTLYIKTDTSFAPPLEGYRSIQGTALFHGRHLLQWSSARQAFVTLSTAEAELVGYVDGFQQGQSIDGLLKIFGFNTWKRLQGDCKAALAQISSDATAWRTRHLRLRASRLRELVMDRESKWSAEHIPGLELAPDGFTKVLVGQAFKRHREQLGMCDVEEFRKRRICEEVKLRAVYCKEDEEMKINLSQGLLGAGVVLLCTEHKLVGSLLLATAGLCHVYGRWEKETTGPVTKGSRPQQELRDGAKTPKGSWDEAAHPPIKGIAGMAQLRGDPQDHCKKGLVESPGFRASRLSSLFSSHGNGDVEERTVPLLRAFRAVGDPSRDQHPLRPPTDLEGRRRREQARSLGTTHGDLYRNFDVPQPMGRRERQWWEDEKFDYMPVGPDKWIQTREGLLIRTHNKPRRRSFHPLHKLLPIDVRDLRSERHTVVFPQDTQSAFVDPRPRFVETDEWDGTTTWCKDFRWRGYTIFVLRSCNLDHPTPGEPSYVDPVLAAPKRAMRPMGGGEQIHQEGQGDEEFEEASGREPAASSSGGYGSDQRMREPPMVQVNVNVYNTSGIATPRAEAPETDDSEFEFVTP